MILDGDSQEQVNDYIYLGRKTWTMCKAEKEDFKSNRKYIHCPKSLRAVLRIMGYYCLLFPKK